jgi:glycosyltransferase involved in cell wall biosynthesis
MVEQNCTHIAELKKVYMVSGAYPPHKDGIGDYTYKLIEALQKCNVRMGLITSSIQNIASDREHVEIFPVIQKWDLGAVRSILRIIKKEQPDVLHLQYPSSKYRRIISLAFLPLFVRFFCMQTKVAVTLHEFSLARPLNKIRQLCLVASSHCVMVSDEGDLDSISRILWWCRCKIQIVPIGSSITKCRYDETYKNKFFDKHGLTRDTGIVIYFGFIHPNKNIESLLKAIALLKQRGMPLFLLMIAELDVMQNAYHRKIKELMQSLGIETSMLWTDYRDASDVSAFLSMSDMCVLPFLDGISLRRSTLMAALVHGLPVISFQGKHVPHELQHKQNIYLISVNNFEKISEAIAELHKDALLRRKIAENGQRTAERFSWDKIAITHKNLYQQMIKGD